MAYPIALLTQVSTLFSSLYKNSLSLTVVSGGENERFEDMLSQNERNAIDAFLSQRGISLAAMLRAEKLGYNLDILRFEIINKLRLTLIEVLDKTLTKP